MFINTYQHFVQLCMMTFGLKSQFTTVYDTEQAGLAKIRKLKWALFIEKAKSKQLGEEFEIERYAKWEAEELLDAWKLQIEFTAVEHYKECLEYFDKLGDYTVRAYLACLDKVT